jgi:hypothetical protein
MLWLATAHQRLKATAMEREPLPQEQGIRWDDFPGWIEKEQAAQKELEGTLWRPFGFAIGALLFVVALVFIGYATSTRGHYWLWLGALIPLAFLGAMVSRAWRRIERDGGLPENLDRLEQKRKSHWNAPGPR